MAIEFFGSDNRTVAHTGGAPCTLLPMENPVTSSVELNSAPTAVVETDDQGSAAIEAELLIEEISIDGMCGVY